MLQKRSIARLMIPILTLFLVIPNLAAPAQAAKDVTVTIKSNKTYKINDSYDSGTGNSYIFVIRNNVTNVTLDGENADWRYERTCIVIQQRTTQLNLTIKNAQLEAPTGKPAIDIESGTTGKVCLNIDGRVSLKGYSKYAGIHVAPGITLALNEVPGTNGDLTVVGGSHDGEDKVLTGGAGIGGNNGEGCGTIEIYGGTINASGTLYQNNLPGGAGIGSGNCGVGSGKIEIKGGSVTGKGGIGAAGIGGGSDGTINEIYIQAGTATGSGGPEGAGIGGGKKNGCKITIAGGSVHGNGGASAAGIGGGNRGSGGTITITGGTVTGNGGANGAGIGGGEQETGGTINITNGTITATGGLHGAGIGSGSHNIGLGEGSGGTITINGGTVYAYGACWGAGIGGATGSNGGNITINGGNITAISRKAPNSDSFGAGIGGGNEASGGNITITGGTITARSEGGTYPKTNESCGGAGIGGGNNGAGGTVLIKGKPIINAVKEGAHSNAENIGRGHPKSNDPIASGSLQYDVGNNNYKDVSYVIVNVSHKPAKEYQPLEGAVVTGDQGLYAPTADKTNSQGSLGVFIERGVTFNYTAEKDGFKSGIGQLKTEALNHEISVKLVSTMGLNASPLKLKAGTALTIAKSSIKGTYYLLPQSEQFYDQKESLAAAASKSVPQESETTETSMDTTGIQEGSYQLYKASDSGGVSAPINILVDNTSPLMKTYKKAANNSYIDLYFSEGVYGLNSAPLASENLKLTLTNGADATVSIEAIKKNDKEDIASATPLKGGEDVIRVFIKITGTLNGKERIELKPSDANCIFDEVQNAMDASQTTGKISLAEKQQPPIVSNGTIVVSKVTKTGATLTWEKASDEDTPDTELEYSVYQLTSAKAGQTVEEVEKGSVIKEYSPQMTSFELTGLSPGSAYYFNVIVKDENNTKNFYRTVLVTTKQTQSANISPATVTFDLSKPADVNTSISWGDCTTITDVVNGKDHLLKTGSCTIDKTKNHLMIGKDYLLGLNKKETEKTSFNISFDNGSNAVFTVSFTKSNQDDGKDDQGKDDHSKREHQHERDLNPNEITIPVEKLAGMPGNSVKAKLDLSELTLPSNMLSPEAAANAKQATITVNRVDVSKLPAELVAQIADRPILEFELKLDGKLGVWNNPNAPITIAIPYKPTEEELKNLDNITVWYIDGNGRVVSVPSGRYDEKSGKVVFTVTHFSKYAVSYVKKNFTDIDKVSWANKQIEALAAKGIMDGRTERQFDPNVNVTRAEYISALVRALGVSGQPSDNFSDISKESNYYDDIAVAKMLDIAKGVGNNCFNPEAPLSREDMLVLTERALRNQKKISIVGTGNDLKQFSDKKELSAYAISSIATLVKEGLIEGSNGRLNAHSSATRAEAAVFLYRLYKISAGSIF